MEAAASQGDPLLGALIAEKYKILAKLGTGGMGGIYKAEQLPINRVVALKILRAQLKDDETLIKRFHQEARTASKLTHPNAVTLFDFGLETGRPYLVMEFIEGKTLKSIISEDKRLELPRVKIIMRQICGALNEAHSLGIIHRDIKPENIMLRRREDGSEWVKVLDFGIAKTIGSTIGNLEANLTQVGTIVGTPQYMSPEQCHGKELDQRSDIFSLGIVLYEMLAGEIPFQAPSVLELMVKVINSPAEPITARCPDLYLPEEIDKVVLKALEKDVDKRYQTINELLEDIESAFPDPTRTFQAGRTTASLSKLPESPTPPRRPGALIGGLGAVGLLALLGVVFFGRSSPPPVRPGDQIEDNVPPDPKVIERVKELTLLLRSDEETTRLKALQELIEIRTPQALEALQEYTVEEEKRRQELAERAEAERQQALKRAADMEREAQRFQEAAARAQAEKRELERQQKESEQEAERVRLAAEQEAERARQESVRLREAAAKAEAERAALAKRAADAAQAEAARQEALKQAEAARAEAERLAAQAAKAEADRLAILEKQKKEAAERAEREAATRAQREAEARQKETEAKQQADAARAEAARLSEEARRADQAKKEEQERALQAARQRALLKKAEQDKEAREAAIRAARERAAQERAAQERAAQERAARERAAQERAREEALRKARQTTPPPPPISDGDDEEEDETSDSPKKKKRRRCGPTWCN